MDALPYLQKVTLKRDHVFSFDTYPFSIPAVNHLFEMALFPKSLNYLASL